MTTQPLISSVFRNEVLAMSAYQVADASGLIKLDAMENPYNWPEAVTAEWLEKLRDCPLNRYPDPAAKQLTTQLKTNNQLPNQFDVLLGNGSDEIIQLLLMALKPKATVLTPEPGFVMYRQIAHCLGLEFQSIPLLAENFDLDLSAMLEAIENHQPALIFLAYPNNPTGNLFSEQAIRKIIAATPGLVVIDEAYAPFANASFIGSLGEYSNLLIMRTVSKLGLAGLRLGYLCGNADIIEQLHKIRLPYNINILTQISAEFALAHKTLFEQQSEIICRERTTVFNQLNDSTGITAYPSAANFILFRTPENKAGKIFHSLKQQGVLIKNLSPQGGLLNDCLRVTIGKPDENRQFIKALTNSLDEI